jgi:hypothetical protein
MISPEELRRLLFVDVGTDNETPVTEDYQEGRNKFTGRIHKVTVEVK